MIVLIAGMPRSGSTFTFNVVREILERRGRVYHEASEDVLGAIRRSGGAAHVIVKAHYYDTASLELARVGGARIVMSVRRIEDAMASWLEIFGELSEGVSLQVMRNWLRMYRELHGNALIVPFRQVDRRPWLATWRIARAICPECSLAEVVGIAWRYRKAVVKRRADALVRDAAGVFDGGFTYYDTTTFFHRRHVSELISGPAEARMTAERLVHIRRELADDIKTSGLVT